MPSRYTSSADVNAMVARVAPAVLELLADGVPQRRIDGLVGFDFARAGRPSPPRCYGKVMPRNSTG